MDILTLLTTIARRWLVVVPILLITAVMAFSVGGSIKPEYGMRGTVLLASNSGSESTSSDGAAVVTAPVLAEILRTPAVNKRMADAGASAPYVVEVDATTSILRITAAGREGPANIRSVDVVLENLDEELELLERTAGVPNDNRASVRLLSRPGDQPGGGLPSASGSAFLVPARPAGPKVLSPNSYTTRVVTELMLAADSRRKVSDRAGRGATFLLTTQPRDVAPILAISVESPDRRLTEATYQAVVDTINDVLDEKQAEAGINEESRTSVSLLNTPAGATKTSGTVVKSVATVVGLGLIVAATAAILTESLLAGRSDRRRRSRGDRRGEAESPPVETAADVEPVDAGLAYSANGATRPSRQDEESAEEGADAESRSSTTAERRVGDSRPADVAGVEPNDTWKPIFVPAGIGKDSPGYEPTRNGGPIDSDSEVAPRRDAGEDLPGVPSPPDGSEEGPMVRSGRLRREERTARRQDLPVVDDTP